jgi:primosomal protein N' (replication factor Y)
MIGNQDTVLVTVAAPVKGLFSYSVPESMSAKLQPGHLVEVPFGKTTKRGVVIGFGDGTDIEGIAIKPVKRLIDEDPILSNTMLRTLKWAAEYYLAPEGEMVFAALPPVFRKKGKNIGEKTVQVVKILTEVNEQALGQIERRAPLQAKILRHLNEVGSAELPALANNVNLGSGVRQALRSLAGKELVSIEKVTKFRAPQPVDLPLPDRVKHLSSAQAEAFSTIVTAIDDGKYEAFLLHGVTSSGKTEVYLRAIAHALNKGQGAILLVPEISLTPQLRSRVTARFGSRVAVLHSGLSQGERLDEWRRLQQGTARVAIGARSAVFAPVKNPAIIIVDEEHDSSYKQSDRLPYNGRDLAMVRAREEKAVVLLGSATPSVEAFAHAQQKRSLLLKLPNRINERPMPEIEVVDLKESLPDPIERQHTISPRLAECLAETLDRKEQAILFLNRRGYSSFAVCKDCGQSIKCKNCSVSLVHHLHDNSLQCHYCGLSMAIPNTCTECQGGRIQLLGLGTEKCEEEVNRRFPGARVIRLDSDSTAQRGSLQTKMSKFASGEADILIGTQMVTKGHDLPRVTLVGVLLADLGLNLPDFRAAERTFQLLVQVAGRAGRGDTKGRVIVQTMLPKHESIVLAKEYKFEEFIEKELKRREMLGYPPRKRLMLVRVSHPDQHTVHRLARDLAKTFRDVGRNQMELLGPVVSPLAKLRGRYRWQMLVKSPSVRSLQQISKAVQNKIKVPNSAKINFDVDPVDML